MHQPTKVSVSPASFLRSWSWRQGTWMPILCLSTMAIRLGLMRMRTITVVLGLTIATLGREIAVSRVEWSLVSHCDQDCGNMGLSGFAAVSSTGCMKKLSVHTCGSEPDWVLPNTETVITSSQIIMSFWRHSEFRLRFRALGELYPRTMEAQVSQYREEERLIPGLMVYHRCTANNVITFTLLVPLIPRV